MFCDFVIMHKNLEVIKQCQKIMQDWLKEYDLEIKPEKTRICHTLESINNEKPGFNFLGFNIRQYPVGKNRSGKNAHGEKLGFKTLIKPTDESVHRHYAQIAEICKVHNNATQASLINKLNPIIRGWTNYFKTSTSSEIYSKLGHLTYLRLWRWAKRRHPNKSANWIVNKYWKTIGQENWVFGDKTYQQYKHTNTKIERFVKVRGIKSPFDGDTKYWAKRMGKHPERKDSVAKLLKKQKGRCNWCGLDFHNEDKFEIDHITPKAMGGTYKDNLQLLHKHCHDVKTKEDLVSIKKHKIKKEWQKTLERFNKMDWKWVDDIPTLA